MERKNIWLVGGDERQAVLAGLLADDGHRVYVYAMEKRMHCQPSLEGIGGADCVILPLPALSGCGVVYAPLSEKEVRAGELLMGLRPGQTVLAGKAG